MKVFYHADNDGRCAAFLLWKWFQKKQIFASQDDFIEINYDVDIPLEKIEPDEMVYFLDFCPQEESDYKWLSENTDLMIVDHHISHKDYLADMLQKYNNSDTFHHTNHIIDINYCGAMLVAKHFLEYTDDNMPEFIKLVDDWDRWVHALPMSKYFQAGSQMYDTSPFGTFWSTFWLELGDRDPLYFIRTVIDNGNTILAYQARNAKELCDSIGFKTKFEGYNCFCLNQAKCNSTWFNSVPNCDIGISFYFNGKQWSVSLYSKTVDVSEIAKSYGGGGHTGAAGFQCQELPFKVKRDPTLLGYHDVDEFYPD